MGLLRTIKVKAEWGWTEYKMNSTTEYSDVVFRHSYTNTVCTNFKHPVPIFWNDPHKSNKVKFLQSLCGTLVTLDQSGVAIEPQIVTDYILQNIYCWPILIFSSSWQYCPLYHSILVLKYFLVRIKISLQGS